MKRSLVRLGLALFAAWPAIQFALVSAYDVNPWKLGGWAMYAAPTFAVDVFVFEVRKGKGIAIPDRELSARARGAKRKYRSRRTSLGHLVGPPDALGRAVLRGRPQAAAILVAVQSRRLRRDTARIETALERHLYEARREPG